MDMKNCRLCGKEFQWKRKGTQLYCSKECSKEGNRLSRNKASREHYKEDKLDYYIVYYLPNEHYCGITNRPERRMWSHDTLGKDTTDWRVLACADTRIEALAIECEFHLMGMNGHIEMSRVKNKDK